MSNKRFAFLLVLLFPGFAKAQSPAPPFEYQVLMYSAIRPNGQFPDIYTYNGATTVELGNNCPNCANLSNPSNFTPSVGTHSISGLTSTLNASIATALSVIPLASPSSGVITRTDPATGAQLPVSSTLGPIFTERAETIGRHRFYIGFSNQDFHFTSFNGQRLRSLQLMDIAADSSNVTLGGRPLKSFPVTSQIGVDARLSQNVAFLTYGLASRFDVSVALPVVHASISGHTYNAQIYAGNGFANGSGVNPAYGDGQGGGNCWCVGTFTAGMAPASNTVSGLTVDQVNFAALSKTGFGDMLLRFKGTVLESRSLVVALGTDLRLPTGDERNFLGTGATAIKPFVALSLYTKPVNDWLVFSPHLNVGWQYAGKSVLGGELVPTQIAASPRAFGAPLTTTKDYLPDVFSWAVGSEIAVGPHHTVVLDVLGNQIGWVHGSPNMAMQSISNVPLVGPMAGTAQNTTASGFVSAGRESFGEYSGAFGYKARVLGNLVATFNMLVRFDDNSLRARAVPLFGLSYTF